MIKRVADKNCDKFELKITKAWYGRKADILKLIDLDSIGILDNMMVVDVLTGVQFALNKSGLHLAENTKQFL